LDGIHSKFHNDVTVFEDLLEAEVEEFNKKFPFMEKLRLPGQWGYEEKAGIKQS